MSGFAPPVYVVAARGLRKTYAPVVAVDHIDLFVPERSIFGLVGPNGAGKTTTIKMLIGLTRPDSGTVEIDGVATWPDPVNVKALLGVVPDGLSLFERLTGFEHVHYCGMLRGIDNAEASRRADALLGVLGLSDDASKLVIDYSHGMRKKVALASALVHRPRVLVLDEPFEGIDPVSSIAIRKVLDDFRRGGGTVLLSSHVMDTIERLCDHLAVIVRGRVARSGPTASFTANGRRLEDAFVDLVGSSAGTVDLPWLHD